MFLKKLVAITLLLVFLYNLCGIIFVFKYQQYAIRKEMKHKIKAGVPVDQLAKIIVNSENEQELDWKHGKEFRYRGIMYDVVKKETNADGSVLYLCVTDMQETELFANLDNLVKETSNKRSNGKNNLKRLFHIFSSIIVSEKLSYCLNESITISNLSEMNLQYLNPCIEGNYPPPKI